MKNEIDDKTWAAWLALKVANDESKGSPNLSHELFWAARLVEMARLDELDDEGKPKEYLYASGGVNITGAVGARWLTVEVCHGDWRGQVTIPVSVDSTRRLEKFWEAIR